MRRELLIRCTPPEWNIKVLTQDDFDYYCDRDDIVVSETPLEQSGLYIRGDSQSEIFLNDELRGAQRLFIAFHELAHHWLRHPSAQMFHARDEKENEGLELEADIVAICCLIPATMLPHYYPSEIAELHGYTRDLVEFRRKVFDHYKI